MNAVENRIRKIAVFLINAQTIEGVAETMNRIAVLIDGYSESVATYFTGLYEYIDSNDRAFQPLTDDEKRKVQNLGARLLLNREDIVTALVRLHHLLKWMDGENAIVELADRLDPIAKEKGFPTVKWDD